MEKQRITSSIAVDPSGAFDVVDHDIRLDVLNNRSEISHTALRRRSFKVNVGAAHSTCRPLAFSVPQGSRQAQMLYSRYAGTMQEIVGTDVDIHGYGDDRALNTLFFLDHQGL